MRQRYDIIDKQGSFPENEREAFLLFLTWQKIFFSYVFFIFALPVKETFFIKNVSGGQCFSESDLHAREYTFERGIGSGHIGVVSDVWFA